jgi:cysteine-rich repeat protein
MEGLRERTKSVPLSRSRSLCISRSVLALVLICWSTVSQLYGSEPAVLNADIDRLRDALGSGASISLERATGTVSFLRCDDDTELGKSSRLLSRHDRTTAFLAAHGRAFGLKDGGAELELLSDSTDQYGFGHVRYRQIYHGVPVFGSDFRSHFDRAGRLVTISASTVPIDSLDPIARVDPTRASRIAVAVVVHDTRIRVPVDDLDSLEPELFVFRTGLAQGVRGRNHLAYRVEVVDDARSVREFVFVDAHTGKVLDRYTGIHHSLDREIYLGDTPLPGILLWEEGDALPYSGDDAADINAMIDFAEDSYNFFLTLSGGTHPSYNGTDATMVSVFDDPALFCSLLGVGNASWNGMWTSFCLGTAADDVVAHEWAHGYSESTHGLIYQWQPGALNESFSDIFGEVVDRLNGAGTDTPDAARSVDGSACTVDVLTPPGTENTVVWMVGEDAWNLDGPVRDMWRPECFGDPGRVTSASYWCSEEDFGGVHHNSGVPNHAFALLVEGGAYNSQTMTGVGLTRAAHIYWYAMTTYQGPMSDFADHADALEASCAALIGADLPALSTDAPTVSSSGSTVSATHCEELSKVIAAVELRTAPDDQCGFEPILEQNPPVLCTGLGEKTTISLTEWETGLGGWTAGTRSVTNPSTFDTPDWAVVSGLPDGRLGMAAFVENSQAGDCETDLESGVLFLQSPTIEIPGGTTVPRVAVNHWIATEKYYDGGNLKISVNGGAYSQIPRAAFDVGPYNETIAVITPLLTLNDNPLAGEEAFSGTDGGQPDGSWGASHINLYGIAGIGDTITLRFEFGIDGCGGVDGWYVDEVDFYSCADELPPSDCGNGVLDDGEVCDDGNAINEDGCSNSCQVEHGWTCTDPTAGGTIDDHSFEAGTPNPYWDEASINLGSPLCNPDCFVDAADDGDWYAWFGGVLLGYEESSLSQTVTIPQGNSTLRFFLWSDACNGAQDYLEVLIDGEQVWSVNGTSPLCGRAVGSYQDVDIGDYDDGEEHHLEFHCETTSVDVGFSNFFVDVVTLVGQPSVCTIGSTEIFVDGFESGDTAAWAPVALPP